MSGTNIKVVCRFRPQNKLEIREGGVPIIDISEEGTSVVLKGKETQAPFSFDRVFGSDTRQQDVFEYSIKSIVDDVVAGYNGTVFAYGQTGSGKTFTMMGSSIDDVENKGIIPRIVEQIFESIMVAPPNMEFTVKVSYMEIYMEKVRDLLNPSQDNLQIHEDKTKGVYVKGVLEVYVSSTEEVYEVMRSGGNNRMVAYTHMNAESSRSHSLVMITITQKNLDTGAAKSGKLYLVDLAGSEKVGKTGASGQTLEEAKKINKSLTALGMVINALTDGKSNHVPYRDSKLTRILQESLGGNSRTTLIINCSPSSYNEAETLGTLRFGARAKTIKNKAKVNADLSPAELKALLKKVKGDSVSYQQYITALEGEITVWRSGGKVPELKWVSMEKLNKGDLPQPPAPAFKPLVDDSRPSTPAIALENDERDELLKRENDLVDQIAEKEAELASKEKLLLEIQGELDQVKEKEKSITADNQQMVAELNDVKIQLQKVSYESKESGITVDSLKEANQELLTNLESLRASLAQLRSSQPEPSKSTGSDVITEKQNQPNDTLEKLDEKSETIYMSQEEIMKLRQELIESKELVGQQESAIHKLSQDKETLTEKRTDLENRLATLEAEYEELLDKTIAEEEHKTDGSAEVVNTITELRAKLENQHVARIEAQEREIIELRAELAERQEAGRKLNELVEELKAANEKHKMDLASQPTVDAKLAISKDKEFEVMRKRMAQQLAELEQMRKALMRDLQVRCERVVELEFSLEELREQYNNILRATSNKAQQKKMNVLERNLEQLTNVQKQLVEQNSALKQEVAASERTLRIREEKIKTLETKLGDSNEKYNAQTQKFETQLQTVRGRLEHSRTQKAQNNGIFSSGKIAKPLRGGGVAIDSEISSTTKQAKRSTWLGGLF
ncbi:hypothetical protein DFQ28_009667 [Apophysomyces sp. BC1034]|nr:hypothetical protein DFQ30_009916 [Apophysomyces sp. BC1015]KAG0182091.1 hypothetical protein DFQ29_005785 [Apophysomyces sp. BC1021]KAG0192262.1 hypothetical protein DFQ28_009667 [Apophysomyces sp. BC1034]